MIGVGTNPSISRVRTTFHRNESIKEYGETAILARQGNILRFGVDEHQGSIKHFGILGSGMPEYLGRNFFAKQRGLWIHGRTDHDPPYLIPL